MVTAFQQLDLHLTGTSAPSVTQHLGQLVHTGTGQIDQQVDMELPPVIDRLDFPRSPDPNRTGAALPCAASKPGQNMLQPAMLALHLVDAIIEVRASMRQDRDPSNPCGWHIFQRWPQPLPKQPACLPLHAHAAAGGGRIRAKSFAGLRSPHLASLARSGLVGARTLRAPITIFRLPLGSAAVLCLMSATRAARSWSMRWMLSVSAVWESDFSLWKSVIISPGWGDASQFVVWSSPTGIRTRIVGGIRNGDGDRERAMW